MKVSSEWKKLTQAQRRVWNKWAKDHPVLLDNGVMRRVSGRKAMTMVLRNRAIAGEAAKPAVVPNYSPYASDGALSLRDAGPFTENAGYVGFRVEQYIPPEDLWFVWATPPVGADEQRPHRLLRFVKCFGGEYDVDDLTVGLGADYQAVCGPWDGPGEDGAWPVDTFIWFRLHVYSDGQLSPGVMMRGRIQVEL
ncbi:MAG TPA: hypothetical protein PKA41_08375 [Verrucomicrobiota bacterium]|nr:hypothetical protein [Verrucomicrobiota bacterium]